jgi:hypothetical protein
MHIDLDAPVIAVFGSNSTKPQARKDAELKAAEVLAAEIYRAGAILLTGAAPPTGGFLSRPDTVKDVAVYRAEQESSPEKPAAWVGVARKEGAIEPQSRGLRAFVVAPGWLDRRNLVEALICDTAIAVGCASSGTESEALFSLFGGRRLVVVADNPSDIDVSPRALKKSARHKVMPAGNVLAVDRGIAAAYDWAESATERAEVRPLPIDEAAAAELVAELLTPDPRHYPRPDLDNMVDEPNWDDFVREALRAAGRWPT